MWSYGHRNPQGLAMAPDGTLWEAEMGPQGGDEINLIEKGKNYGWPDVTYGREYTGQPIGQKSKAGITEPVAYWAPSISPSAIGFYTGSTFPSWRGNLFVGTLSGQHLRRLKIENKKVTEQEELLKSEHLRVRNVRTGPDGYLYISTDSGLIARLTP
jgi:glucose/arabinose dehydrogenase